MSDDQHLNVVISMLSWLQVSGLKQQLASLHAASKTMHLVDATVSAWFLGQEFDVPTWRSLPTTSAVPKAPHELLMHSASRLNMPPEL